MFVIVCMTTFWGDDAEVSGVYGVYPSQDAADAACERLNAEDRTVVDGRRVGFAHTYTVEPLQDAPAA